MGTSARYSHVVRMVFFPQLYKIEFYERKQSGMFINMDVCPLDKLLNQCHTGPITSWWNLVISERGGREKESKGNHNG